MKKIGFNLGNHKDKETIYDSYIGKAGIYICGNLSVKGVFVKINTDEKYIAIKPSIVNLGSELRLETEEPTILSLPQSGIISRVPLKMEDLERIVKEQVIKKK
ncbi:MAG: hypothetical protein QT05_C0008G0003 [archaeon GW2011_AR13]|nr:MAG: hypothetical protein QT05_C0008G0003 [archaeon GW2011_AR13]HIG95062.1 hypothetical protein [Nanoarchaeota archaeon]HIH62768.1 hypothetical protein [Nanoarchaeota archaeon]HIJ09990.1 hypothetical protein [Nanoarchaeota archaeon]